MPEKQTYEDLLKQIRYLKKSKSELEDVCYAHQKMTGLLDAIRKAQSLYIMDADPSEIYNLLLKTLVEESQSEYGFLDEVLYDSNGDLYKRNLAISDVSWDEESKALYRQLQDREMKFTYLGNLSGLPALTGETIISNDPSHDSRSKGLPQGHPPIDAFMGMPLFFGGKLICVAGVANRKNGYSNDLADFLDPLLTTCASITYALQKDSTEKENDRKIAESEEKLRSMFNASPLSIVLIDRDGRILDSNEVHANRLHKTRNEITGTCVWDLLPQSVQAHRRRQVQNVFETGKPFSGEDQRGEKYNQYHIHPAMMDESGSFEAVIVESMDITGLKKAERQIAETLSWYQAIFEGSKDAIFISDADARFISVNNAACELTNYGVEELLSMKIPDLHEDVDLEAFKKYQTRIMKGEPITSEAKILRKDGKKIDTEFSNKRIAVSSRYFMHSTARDISERKQWEEAIRKSTEKHRSILQTAMDGFVMMDMAGKMLEVNEAYCNMVGYSENELLDSHVTDLIVGESHEEIFARIQNVADKGGCRFESRHRRKDGNIIDVEISSTYQDREKVFIVCFVRDITEKKKQDYELQLRSLVLDQIHDHVTVTNLDGVVSYVNHITENTIGLSKHDIIGKKTEVYGEDANRGATQRQIVEKTLHQGSWRGEVVNFNTDGSEKIMDCRTLLVLNEQGNPIALCGVATDITEYKRFLEKQEKLQKQLASAMNIARLGHWEYDVKNDLFTFNEQFYKIFRTTVAQVGGYSMASSEYARRFVFPEDRDLVGREIRKAIETSDPNFSQQLEHRIVFADGEIGYINVRYFIVKDANGQTVGTYGVNQDITYQKQVENTLRESEMKFRSLVEQAAEMFFLHDLEGRLIDVNLAAIKNTGYSREELKGMSVFEIDPDAHDRKDMHNYWKGIKTGDAPHIFETRHKRKNGTIYPAEITLSKVVLQDGLYILGLARNISERKQNELALRESEEKFRNFTEQSFVGFYIIQEGIFEYVNPKFADIFGYTVDECMSSMHFHQLVHPEDLTTVEEQVRRRVAGEIDVVRYTFRGVKKNGAIIHVSIYGSSLIYRGKPAAIGTMLDITKELELEKRIAQSQRMESIGNLAGGIAHDFNNILFPIVGLSEMLLEDLSPDSPEHENVLEIYNAGRRGSDLVKQILAFSRQSEQKKIPIRVQQILKEVMKLSRSTIPSNITITQTIQSDCRLVMADPTQLHQIMMNLITNAYHAVEAMSGEIDVRLREIEISRDDSPDQNLLPGRYALLSVSDTGVGIDPAIMDKIFEPYFTTKDQGKGTGLGLAVVYGIVKELLGDIKIHSEYGKGTTCDVYLPVMEKFIETVSRKEKEDLPQGHEHILLVDDEEAITKLERQMLERLGYQVTIRIDSFEALETFKAKPNQFDLVLSDMTMPKMTGDQLARELMAIRPDIPIIICTGLSDKLNQEKAKAMGVKSFLMKPIVKAKMAKIVRNVLDAADGCVQGPNCPEEK